MPHGRVRVAWLWTARRGDVIDLDPRSAAAQTYDALLHRDEAGPGTESWVIPAVVIGLAFWIALA
ncbi:MAG: hypothetical protein JJT81_09265 [Rubellimicrobium sp.]|nr:hypothetical protein [Rubellimicrobium sp.]